MTSADVAEALFAPRGLAAELFEELFGGGEFDGGPGVPCSALCAVLLTHVEGLGRSVPASAQMACEDDACEAQVNVSVAFLPPESGDTHVEASLHADEVKITTDWREPAADPAAPIPYRSVQHLLEALLGTFRMYPRLEASAEDAADQSLVEVDPSFGPVIKKHHPKHMSIYLR